MGLSSRRFAWLAAPGLALLGVGLLLLAWEQRAGAVDVPVGVHSNFFSPNSVTVGVGDRVQFNHVSGIHGVAFVGFATPSFPLTSGSMTTNAFTAEGTFYYYCTVHSSAGAANEAGLTGGAMVGRVIVGAGGPPPTHTSTAAPTATPTATATVPPTQGPTAAPTATPQPTAALDYDSVVPGVARE